VGTEGLQAGPLASHVPMGWRKKTPLVAGGRVLSLVHGIVVRAQLFDLDAVSGVIELGRSARLGRRSPVASPGGRESTAKGAEQSDRGGHGAT
jgi:hypothetical protein